MEVLGGYCLNLRTRSCGAFGTRLPAQVTESLEKPRNPCRAAIFSIRRANAARVRIHAPLRNTDASSVPLFPPTFGSLRLLAQSAFQGLAQCMLARTIVSIVLSVP